MLPLPGGCHIQMFPCLAFKSLPSLSAAAWVVYKARDLELNREAALKMVLGGVVAGSAAFQRFLTEAEALAALQHPNVVHVYERGEYQGLPYFAMEFCPGGSLSAKVKDQPLESREAAALIEQLARGMALTNAASCTAT
jgi:eukaryotic-like serine/threonine-protein kinase